VKKTDGASPAKRGRGRPKGSTKKKGKTSAKVCMYVVCSCGSAERHVVKWKLVYFKEHRNLRLMVYYMRVHDTVVEGQFYTVISLSSVQASEIFI
jgi:hypothetical protein